LVHVRSILGNIGVLVLPEQLAINQAYGAFAEDGSLKDARQTELLGQMTHRLVELVRLTHTG
jgi:hypothetical protein